MLLCDQKQVPKYTTSQNKFFFQRELYFFFLLFWKILLHFLVHQVTFHPVQIEREVCSTGVTIPQVCWGFNILFGSSEIFWQSVCKQYDVGVGVKLRLEKMSMLCEQL